MFLFTYFPTVISGIMRLDARARQDVAILGSEFLKLDGIPLFKMQFSPS